MEEVLIGYIRCLIEAEKDKIIYKGVMYHVHPESKRTENYLYDKDSENLNELGAELTTFVLTQGLIAHIHNCHELKLKDSAEHLRQIIKLLEEGFIKIPKIIKP